MPKCALGGVERQGGLDVLQGVPGVVAVLMGEEYAGHTPEVEPHGALEVGERAPAFDGECLAAVIQHVAVGGG